MKIPEYMCSRFSTPNTFAIPSRYAFNGLEHDVGWQYVCPFLSCCCFTKTKTKHFLPWGVIFFALKFRGEKRPGDDFGLGFSSWGRPFYSKYNFDLSMDTIPLPNFSSCNVSIVSCRDVENLSACHGSRLIHCSLRFVLRKCPHPW